MRHRKEGIRLSGELPFFYRAQNLSACSQKSAIVPYPEQLETSSHIHNLFF
jgi:hypothetical protein